VTAVRFRTREIGSLAKPVWRVKALAGRPLDETDVAEAGRWGRRLELDGHDELLEILRRDELDAAARTSIVDWSARYGLALLERAGLDVVYDGEQRRSEMYDHAVRQASGFEQRGSVRAFDDKYFTKAAVVAPPRLETPDVEEYRSVRARTTRAVKVPLTGPYTIVDWSYDEHYAAGRRLGAPAARGDARRRFALDTAASVVAPIATALAAAGADWIQVDEPAAAAKPHETPLMVEAVNLALQGLDVRRSVHVCFSDYRSLWPAVLGLEHCHELQLEFANRDARTPGTRAEDRPGYAAVLPLFRAEGSPRVGLGVLDVHTDFVEPAELVRDRILYATRVLEPDRIEVNPDCGLRTRTWDVAYEKLARMVEGARLAEAAL
jgi:5-methyltetrahydropteroyltriglutamate--homocysteine methyltransferase